MTTDIAPTSARILNMEEKRKLEKLLLTDIDAALSAYTAKRRADCDALEETAVAKAPAEAKALLTRHEKAQREVARTEEALRNIGYRASRGDGTCALAVHYSTKPQIIRDFDAQTARIEKTLTDLKRRYTLKLFAEREDVQELFTSLAGELNAIIR